MFKTPSLLLTKNKDEEEDDDEDFEEEEEEEKKNKAIVDKEERTRSAKAKLSLSIVSVILLWFGSLSVCETVAKYSTTLTSLKARTDDISSSFDRVAFAWERLAREAHEQKVRHERCVERTYRGCEKTLAREIEREEERARTARRENEDAVDRRTRRGKPRERWKCWRRRCVRRSFFMLRINSMMITLSMWIKCTWMR